MCRACPVSTQGEESEGWASIGINSVLLGSSVLAVYPAKEGKMAGTCLRLLRANSKNCKFPKVNSLGTSA